MIPHESAADEDEESGSRQTVYADFDFAMCFLIGGRLMLDYDGNMALVKINHHLALFRISITITLGFKAPPCIDASIVCEGEQFVVLRGIAK